MIVLTLVSPLVLSSGVANAAPVPVWTGPGPRACIGRCPLDWAMDSLSPERRAAVVAAMAAHPVGYSIPVQNGAVFEMMSYYDKGPQADLRHTVAVLDEVEPAMGWQFDGWAFVKIEGCQNWAVMLDPPTSAAISGTPAETVAATGSAPTTGGPYATAWLPPSGGVGLPPLGSTPDTGPGTGVTDIEPDPVIDVDGDSDETDPPGGPGDPDLPPSTVPLPASLWLALLGLLSLATWRKVAGRTRSAG